MEIGIKTIAAGAGLFILGGLSVYLLTSNNQSSAITAATVATTHQSVALQEAIEEMRTSGTEQGEQSVSIETNTPETTPELTHEAFLAAAAARREERQINKEETDRLAKLKTRKEQSVECKFWRQQQKTSSAAAKIEAKVDEFCNLPSNSEASISSDANTSSLGNTE